MIKGVLFDLDGTLADTAPDLAFALNRQREKHGLEELPFLTIRPYVSQGGRGLMKVGFNLAPGGRNYDARRAEFLNFYEERLCHDTQLFPGIPEVLAKLEAKGLPWGVVTNKIERFTLPLMRKLKLNRRASCIISGDSAVNFKPHPEPLLLASGKIGVPPPDCVYVGDDERDVQAARAAGMQSMVARYGYLGKDARPEAWGANAYILSPHEILQFI